MVGAEMMVNDEHTSAATQRSFSRIIAVAVILVWGFGIGFGLRGDRSPNMAVAATPVAIAPGVCTPPNNAAPSAPRTRTPSVGVPADATTSSLIATTIANMVACWNDGDWTAGVAMATDHYLEMTAGTVDRAASIASLAAQTAAGLGAQSSLDAVTDVRRHADGFASADVVWRQGKAAKHQRWHLLAAGETWLLDEAQDLESVVTGDAVGIEATIDAGMLSLTRDRIVSPGIVVIHVRNLSGAYNTLSVFRIAGPAELTARLSAPPQGGESAFIGEIVLAPTTEADLVLVDLSADAYSVVVGFRGADGTLQVRDAFTATLAIARA